MLKPLTIEIADESAMRAFGTTLAACLPTHAVVGLIGPLGAGKTRLVQAVAAAAGVEEGIVASPTFVLLHEYAGRVPIFHFDAYRLRSEQEFLALGSEEYLSQDGWCFIEWADRVAACLPDDRLEIVIEPIGATQRRLILRCLHQRCEPVVQKLRQFITI